MTAKEGIFLPCLHSCREWGWPALLLCQLYLSLSLPSGPMLWFTDTAAALSEKLICQSSLRRTKKKKTVKQTQVNYRYMSIKISFFRNCQPQRESIRYDDLKQERSSGETGLLFFGLVAMETIVLPSSFLSCIPPHNVMKSKLPFNKADWSVVWKRRGWRLNQLKGARELKKEEKVLRASGAQAAARSLVSLNSQGRVLPDIR